MRDGGAEVGGVAEEVAGDGSQCCGFVWFEVAGGFVADAGECGPVESRRHVVADDAGGGFLERGMYIVGRHPWRVAGVADIGFVCNVRHFSACS